MSRLWLEQARFLGRWTVLIPLVMCCSCAIHYYDPDTGVEHVWGFGHMKMKIAEPNEGLRAVVHGTDVVGLGVGKAPDQSYLTLGWQRVQSVDIRDADTALRLEWPTSSFGSVRVGSEFPSFATEPKE